MSTKAADKKRRPTTMVPVTTMEEIPVLADDEREALVQSLQDAEQRIRAGEAIDYDQDTLKQRLLGVYRSAKK